VAAGGQAVRAGRPGGRRGVLPRLLRARPALRRTASSQPVLLLLLTALAVLFTALTGWRPDWFPVPVASLLILVGGFFLRLRQLLLYYLVVAAGGPAGGDPHRRRDGGPRPAVRPQP
jgi:hypothetical protein